MMKKLLFPVLLFTILNIYGQSNKLDGDWNLVQGKSSVIELYRNLHLKIRSVNGKIHLFYRWGNRYSFSDTIVLNINEKATEKVIHSRIFPANVFMGLQMAKGTTAKVIYEKSNNNEIKFKYLYKVSGSQGIKEIEETHILKLEDYGEIIEYRINRSTRDKADQPVYYLKKHGAREAYFVKLDNDWEVAGGLSNKAFMLGIQGIVNRTKPNLYFIYPDDWEFRFTPGVFDFLKTGRSYGFRRLQNEEDILKVFGSYIKGYVVWDKQVRTSLMVAFTIAGLKDAAIVTTDQLPLMKKYDIRQIADLRGKYSGMSDYEIFKSAYNEYGKYCNKENIVWLGGISGKIMKPAVADWGVQQRSFFVNLSTEEKDSIEYGLSKKILSELKPYSMVMGWHAYDKDKERDYVKLTSHYALRVLGLNTLPNMSFTSQVPVTEGFEFKNNHHIKNDETLKPQKKVYIGLIQTDGLGLGAWTEPGRGEIPYAWEVTMNWHWLAPAMLEYFYSQASPNDYFIGALSGPGYIYPKAVPADKLPQMIFLADSLMKKLDLKVFEIMDYSEGSTIVGNTELTLRVVEAYYKGMPDAIGFVNGYAPAFSFYCKDGRPLISYDYYLSPERKESDVIADLKELAAINSERPYFLLVHVREWSDIKRVKEILDKLDNRFEVVPLDIFLKMAGQTPTFKENLLKEK